MEILRAIEQADLLCPNPYTLEEKLMWCDEVTADMARNILKTYDVIETDINVRGELTLPDDIPFERVEIVYCGGVPFSKQDFRSYIASRPLGSVPSLPSRLRAVYLKLPEKIRHIDIRGEFNTGDCIIEIEQPPFREGDLLEIVQLSDLSDEVDFDKAEKAYVIEASEEKIILDWDAVPAQTSAKLAIRRAIDDLTLVNEAPYDRMYIEYILAKIALYQRDYSAYNAHMTQYNSLYESMRREYKGRSPVTNLTNFKNYSSV